MCVCCVCVCCVCCICSFQTRFRPVLKAYNMLHILIGLVAAKMSVSLVVSTFMALFRHTSVVAAFVLRYRWLVLYPLALHSCRSSCASSSCSYALSHMMYCQWPVCPALLWRGLAKMVTSLLSDAIPSPHSCRYSSV